MSVTPVTNTTAEGEDVAQPEDTQNVQNGNHNPTVEGQATDTTEVLTDANAIPTTVAEEQSIEALNAPLNGDATEAAPELVNEQITDAVETPVNAQITDAVDTAVNSQITDATAPEEAAAATKSEPEATQPAQPPVSLMEQLLNENEAISRVRKLEYGQAIEGILMHKGDDRDDFLVDIGTKSEGTVPNRERQSLSAERFGELRVGDRVLVVVVRPESGPEGEDGPILSIDKARTEVSWRKLQQQFEANEVFEVDVVGYNKGGLMVEVEGVRGFIPASQVNALSGIGESEENRQSQMSKLVNTKLLVKIVEVNRDRNRLILSERQAVREQREANKTSLMKELEKDQIREGVVTTLAKFGAFVDLGGVDGLVHVSELSWARIDDPKQILHVGQKVKVYILDVDHDKQKVALSIKRTQPEPWTQVMNKYQVGEVVEATISQLSNFGAFARLEEGLEGLIHISELAEGRVEKPSDIVKAGDKVKVRILRIDPDNRRLALSLKKASENPETPTEEE